MKVKNKQQTSCDYFSWVTSSVLHPSFWPFHNVHSLFQNSHLPEKTRSLNSSFNQSLFIISHIKRPHLENLYLDTFIQRSFSEHLCHRQYLDQINDLKLTWDDLQERKLLLVTVEVDFKQITPDYSVIVPSLFEIEIKLLLQNIMTYRK